MFQQDLPHTLFVVSGPSGSGKETVITHLLETVGGLERVSTYATRGPRPGEVDGSPYHFVSEEKFEQLAEAGELLEFNRTYGRYAYGSPASIIESGGSDQILELDPQGFAFVRRFARRPVVGIFLVPPGLDELRRRIENRSRVSDLEIRLRVAREQLAYAYSYDFVVINDDLSETRERVTQIVEVERLRQEGAAQLQAMMRVEALSDLVRGGVDGL